MSPLLLQLLPLAAETAVCYACCQLFAILLAPWASAATAVAVGINNACAVSASPAVLYKQTL
jgi:hypothetical protein